MILSPQQQDVIDELLPIARIATSGVRTDMPICVRTNSLIISPSGGGKSHVASAIGVTMRLPTLIINVSSWVVLSARNEPWTFSSICQWLDSLDNGGGVIIIEEIDKLTHSSNINGGEWGITVKMEVMQLLDYVIPMATKLPVDKSNLSSWETPPPSEPITVDREILQKRLRERVFIVGCGAWQHAWRNNTRKIGFPMDTPSLELPSNEQLLISMDPELRQRFRNQVCWLRPMTQSDYLNVSEKIAESIQNPETRRIWRGLADAAIEQALTGGLGMRVFEELMLTVMLQTTKFREPMDNASAEVHPVERQL